MTSNSKALLSFMVKDISAKFLITFAAGVIKGVDGNSNFPNQDTVMIPLKIKYKQFEDAWKASLNGTSAAKQKALRLKGELQIALKAVCNFVNYVAAGSRTLLLSTNFILNKETRRPVVLTEVKEFAVKYGINEGEMIPSFKKQKGTTSVGFQYTEDAIIDENTKWITIQSNRSRCVIGCLIPGSRVTFRIAIGGPRGQLIFSRPITRFIGDGQ